MSSAVRRENSTKGANVLAPVDTTTNRDELASNPAALLGSQQKYSIRNVLNGAHSLLGPGDGDKVIFERLDFRHRRQRVRQNRTRSDGVDSDAFAVTANLFPC